MTDPTFGDKIIFDKPPKKPKGWYVKKAKDYIKQFLKAIKDEKCITDMSKIPMKSNPNKNEQIRMYNAIKSLKRRGHAPVDVSIIEGDLWLIYEG